MDKSKTSNSNKSAPIKSTKKDNRKGYKEKVELITNGLLHSLTDVCLFTFLFPTKLMLGGQGTSGLSNAIYNSVRLTKIINAYNLKRVVYRIKSRGYLQRKKDYYKITQKGTKRLKQILPEYEKERPWDGIIYLIVYDVSEEKRYKRDILRKYLQKLKCGLLQQSVWITCYNPKKHIANFVIKRRLAGRVLVSELREGSKIGGQEIKEILNKVYEISDLNEYYFSFVTKVREKKLVEQDLCMNYLSILKKDPQIPFELLPGNWWGKEAYRLYKREVARLKNKTIPAL